MKPIIYLVIALIISSCGDTYSEEDKTNFDTKIENYLNKQGIDCERSSSGLYFKILDEGEGRDIIYKDLVSFRYKGEFLDGKVFDERTDPVEFQVRQLIGAWKEIMLEMKNGGKAFLVAPPYLGYGTHELEAIPPHSILVFNIEVTDVK
ncbi:MAG: FKBP-type peptidyl-prolyl cis-trans isomerase [Crocinitomicaceae bacterium]|nr:FKBP-type peptidyl-prolyl cis-trans isomerase [Crocinitomicaceae bacterium]